ncbi:uncharacterized protein EI97DRAFT_435968 [Westerdykella ornata]|uniref:Hamartin n=1 Tax=Westerdykella ornata TaxID=318751 RepID=A0A6A6JBG7_WESOR|nr:uncharacterized protein EI97DRAFT_435968 [Westerdykella ornata]KAF2273544.1 hypothetical protein EI97DRAFT_435968 [Westerdykella ornata]
MAATGSMHETVRALNTAFAAPTVPCPLPDELLQTIDAFLERYRNIEEHDSQRFHKDFVSIYKRHVATSPDKHCAFLTALRRVWPALAGDSRFLDWYDMMIRPVICELGHKRSDIEEARGFLLDILVFDADEDKSGERAKLSRKCSDKLLSEWLARTRIPNVQANTADNEFATHEVENVLVAFGRRKPKEYILALDSLLVRKETRIQALNLLSGFVRLQPPHLYLVLETPLIEHLEKCLLFDTSSTAIDLALLNLIMLLPHIAPSLTSDFHLAKLFLIYSRVLCWDKITATSNPRSLDQQSEGLQDQGSQEEMNADQDWEQLPQSTAYPDGAPPTILHYFTFLYGLFPLNFMSFLRKSRKYLKSQNFPGAQDLDLDQDLIQSRSEPYRRVHVLHPNLFTTTIEDELAENRWAKADPADIVTECMDLCMAVSTSLCDPGPPPTSQLPPLPVPPVPETENPTTPKEDTGDDNNDGAVSWRNTQSTMFSPSATGAPGDGPPPPTSPKSPGSASELVKPLDVMDSPILPPAKVENKPGLFGDSLMNNPLQLNAPAHRIGDFAQTVSTATADQMESYFREQSMAALQREVMLLRNDLNFERYLKQQHLAHIGQLQRKHIKEATDAAETQNLINANRTLKARLAKANELYAQLKKETLTSRSQSKKWEVELSSKVKALREDQKVWQSSEDELRYELKKTQQDCEHLKRMVEKAEAEQLRAEQRSRALEFELQDYGNLRRELEAMQERTISFQDQGQEMDELIHERDQLRLDLEAANMRLNSRDRERERAIRTYGNRIAELEKQLANARKEPVQSGQLPSSVQQMIDSALAASNAKLQSLKKIHRKLQDDFIELQMKHQELEAQLEADQGRKWPQEERHSYTVGSPETESSLSRAFSFRKRSESRNSRQLAPLITEEEYQDYDSNYSQLNSPVSVQSPPHNEESSRSSNQTQARPVRLEKLHSKPSKRVAPATIGFGQDFSAAFGAAPSTHYHASTPGDGVASSGRSSKSVDTNSSKGDQGNNGSGKAPKSESSRVYGRGEFASSNMTSPFLVYPFMDPALTPGVGGAQAAAKKKEKEEREQRKKEEKEQKKDKAKSGGFRGVRGFM